MKKNKIILLVMITILLGSIIGCKKEEKSKIKVDIFGAEIYNSSIISINDEDVRHVISVMSTKDLTKFKEIKVSSVGGTFELKSMIEKTDYKIGDYKLYKVVLDFSEIKFDIDSIKIEKIKITNSENKLIEMKLNKCEIVKINGEYNTEYLNVNGSPLRIPSDMKVIPLDLSSEYNIKITNIYLTNEQFNLFDYTDALGDVKQKFSPINIRPEDEILMWEAKFKIKDAKLIKFLQCSTSIVIEYEYNGVAYYSTPGVTTTIYNPFDINFDSIKKYYDYLNEV